ncbi:hypothetical protein [Nocardia nepalensis]|uniref:hypothetical protein n=1 Tax=Nocardia nepalensis TaxID=3375448 RepID=UPI003B6852A7
MGTEMVSLVVALTGVLGTLSATVIAQRATFKTQQLKGEQRRRELADDRAESNHRSVRQEKQAVYAELNASARHYRSVAHDCLVDRRRGREVDLTLLETARTSFREVAARAQMVMSERALAVADEVGHGVGVAFRAARGDMDDLLSDPDAFQKLHDWIDRSLIEALKLLRRVLREDLGVAETVEVETACRSLAAERAAAYDHSRYVAMLNGLIEHPPQEPPREASM